MSTRNVVLTPQQEKMIRRLVASGLYQNASEVLREGLRLIDARDADEQARLTALREAARLGIADLEEGRFREFRSSPALAKHLASRATRVIDAAPSRRRSK